MATNLVVNLTRGAEDGERATIAFLAATAALAAGRTTKVFCTLEAVNLGLPGYAESISVPDVPALGDLFKQFVDGGGELFICPICFKSRGLPEGDLLPVATLAGMTPLLEFMGDDCQTLSY